MRLSPGARQTTHTNANGQQYSQWYHERYSKTKNVKNYEYEILLVTRQSQTRNIFIYLGPRKENLADYFTKIFAPPHLKNVRAIYL